jgi:hypothetical protein
MTQGKVGADNTAIMPFFTALATAASVATPHILQWAGEYINLMNKIKQT